MCCQKVSYTRQGLSIHTDSDDKFDLDVDSDGVPDFNDELFAYGGGLIDKPGTHVDPYHTCYALSGLTIAQHMPRMKFTNPYPYSSLPTPSVDLLGETLNELNDIDPFHNVIHEALIYSKSYFHKLDQSGHIDKQEAANHAERMVNQYCYQSSTGTLEYKPSNVRIMQDNDGAQFGLDKDGKEESDPNSNRYMNNCISP